MATKGNGHYVHVEVRSDHPLVVRAVAQAVAERLAELGFSTPSRRRRKNGPAIVPANSMDFDDKPGSNAAELMEQVEQYVPEAFEGQTTVHYVHPSK